MQKYKKRKQISVYTAEPRDWNKNIEVGKKLACLRGALYRHLQTEHFIHIFYNSTMSNNL